MKKIITFTCMLASFASTFTYAQLPANFTSRLNTVLDSVCAKHRIKGASAAVLVPGIGTWKKAYGISYEGQPLRTDMVMGIGSNTKTFTASCMLKLQEAGQLDLDDSIGKWIMNKPNISGQITIRQLLNHTSGVFDYAKSAMFLDSLNADVNRMWLKEEILAFVKAPYFAPGSGWAYSNTNYIIAGIIIEKVTGKPVHQVIREMITDPQHLTETFFFPQETPSLELAHQWAMGITGTSLYDLSTVPGYSNNSLFTLAASAGAIMQTVEDNVKFWRLLTTAQFFSRASWNEMRQFVNVSSSTGYGLGIFLLPMNGRRIYSHGGTNFGYINENAVDTLTGISISVMTNQDSIENDELLTSVVAALHKVTIQIPLGIASQAASPADVQLWPNPASDVIHVSAPGAGLFTLYDLAGKQVFEGAFAAHGGDFLVDKLPAGMYVARITGNDGQLITKKIQLQ